jgi:hypothetical protein
MAARAGFVIAKGALADFCRARALPYAAFADFEDATRRLAEWLDRRSDEAAQPFGGRGQARPSRAASTYQR